MSRYVREVASQSNDARGPVGPSDDSSTDAPLVVAAKETLRRQAKRRRSGLTPDAAELHNRALCDGLADFFANQADSDLNGLPWTVTYSALPGEPDLSGLAEHEVGPLALTRTPREGHRLSIHPLDSSLERHRYGFEQPVIGSDLVPDDQIRAVLVPGLAFDTAGGRLGFGAGYYDRLLRRLLEAAGERQVSIVGISDGLVLDVVPTDSHDVAMTHLATADGVVSISDWNQGKSAY